MAESENEIAHQTQEKFHFYSVALIFTILGLSIQTATFSGHVVSRILELLGWAFLLTSGFTALSHIEWAPVLRVQMAKLDSLNEKADKLKQHKEMGTRQVHVAESDQVVSIEQRIGENENHLSKLDTHIKRSDKKAEIKYLVAKWLFVLGVISIVAARATNPISDIANELSGKDLTTRSRPTSQAAPEPRP